MSPRVGSDRRLPLCWGRRPGLLAPEKTDYSWRALCQRVREPDCVALPAHVEMPSTSPRLFQPLVGLAVVREGPWARVSGAGSVAALREPAYTILPEGPWALCQPSLWVSLLK